MHELSLATALIREMEKILTKESASKVLKITVSIGKLSGVNCDAFEFAFPIAAEGSSVEGARLIIEEIPAKVRCKNCRKESTVQIPFIECRNCGSSDFDIVGGRELTIKSMEIKKDVP